MEICILGPFDPISVKDYLFIENNEKIVSINSTATSVNTLVAGLIKLKHIVVVLTIDITCNKNKIYSGDCITVYVIGAKSYNPLLNYFPPSFFLSRKINKCLHAHDVKFDIIHAHWTYEYALAATKIDNNKPIICSVRDWAPIIYSNIPFRPFYLYFIKKIFWLQKILVQRKVIKISNIHLISNSIYTKQKIEGLKPASNIELIYNSINIDDIVLERHNHPNCYTFISICVSVDDLRKNIDTLVRAFNIFNQKYPNSRLIIIGKIHFDRKLYKTWQSLDLLTNVEFSGLLERREILKLLDDSTCMVHPSLEETFGNVLLEAMARRVPVIGGEDSGAIPYVLKNGECGCLCDINNPVEVCNSMFKIIEHENYTINIINNATEILLKEYSSQVVAKKHLELYNKLLKKK